MEKSKYNDKSRRDETGKDETKSMKMTRIIESQDNETSSSSEDDQT